MQELEYSESWLDRFVGDEDLRSVSDVLTDRGTSITGNQDGTDCTPKRT